MLCIIKKKVWSFSVFRLLFINDAVDRRCQIVHYLAYTLNSKTGLTEQRCRLSGPFCLFVKNVLSDQSQEGILSCLFTAQGVDAMSTRVFMR